MARQAIRKTINYIHTRRLMMSEPFTLYKLIILYMLHKVDMPLSNTQLCEFVLEREYTNYFTIQQAISDSLESGFIRTETTHQKTLYYLTEQGEEAVEFFSSEISPIIRDEIKNYLQEKYQEIKEDISVKADYYKNTNNEFSVNLQIKEGKSDMLNLTLSIPDEKTAQNISDNWHNKNQEVYALLMQHLLQ